MQLRKATRQAAKLKIGVSGTSGSGKTMGALLLAKGLVGDWNKIAVIDTENGSADLYSHLGAYNVLPLTVFSPEKYIEAIEACENAGIEAIVIDSITHEWDFLLAVHGKMEGNSFSNWGKVMPRHERFKNKILQSKCHIITSVRRKTEYEMQQQGSRTVVVKLGTKEETKQGWEYELTLNFEIGQTHLAKASKDRTGIFVNEDEFMITEETGKLLKEWCESGVSDTENILQIALVEVNNVSTIEDLAAIYEKYKLQLLNTPFKDRCTEKKEQIKSQKA